MDEYLQREMTNNTILVRLFIIRATGTQPDN